MRSRRGPRQRVYRSPPLDVNLRPVLVRARAGTHLGGILAKRVLVIGVVAAVIAALAAYFLRPETGVPDDAPTQDEMASAVGTDVMRNVQRGHVPERSGEIMLVPKPHNFLIGNWDLTSLGTDEPFFS